MLPGIILCVIALSSFWANPTRSVKVDGDNTLKFQVSLFIEPAQWKLFGLIAISWTEAKSSPLPILCYEIELSPVYFDVLIRTV